ncbi:NADAR family protein [Paenibacillus nuruki]|uniref:NADAR family protein n=1 Tax=Paenibacillus nuruki TaxID=1886670 RepID=UPI002804C8AD|nr:NADAR family protein [Paenibacillus nuruki]
MEERTYSRRNSIVFRKTNEDFGGLSNMAGGYLININNIKILTSEALYQACRFPEFPEVQKIIISERSPMTAKMKSKPYREKTRRDWEKVRIQIMRWCLRVKLFQNWDEFSMLLKSTEKFPIVEESNRDIFWGARADENDTLRGVNCLGRLLMELREELILYEQDKYNKLNTPKLDNFYLYGKPINQIILNKAKTQKKLNDLDEQIILNFD